MRTKNIHRKNLTKAYQLFHSKYSILPMLYTTQKLFEESGVAPSTCRYWLVKLFSEYSPSQENKKWPEEALLLVREIQKLKQQNFDNEEIREQLRKTWAINAETSKALAPGEFQGQALEHYQRIEELLLAAVTEMQKSNQTANQLVALLIGKETTKSSVQGLGQKKVSRRDRISKKIPQRVAKSPKKKLPARGRGGKFKKKGFWQRVFS